MELSLKPDFDEAKRRWRAYWENEIIDRPAVWITAPKDGVEPIPAPPYLDGWDGDYEAAVDRYWADARRPSHIGKVFGPDAVPRRCSSFDRACAAPPERRRREYHHGQAHRTAARVDA